MVSYRFPWRAGTVGARHSCADGGLWRSGDENSAAHRLDVALEGLLRGFASFAVASFEPLDAMTRQRANGPGLNRAVARALPVSLEIRALRL